MVIASRTRCRLSVLGVFIFLVTICVSPSLADLYTGSLIYDSGIAATDGWRSPGTTITWNVEVTPTVVHYKYTFTVPVGDPSHMIFEVTKNSPIGSFDLSDPRDFDQFTSNVVMKDVDGIVGPELWEGTGENGENPFMPAGGLFGIKFDGDENNLTWEIAFDSERLPMWGDFYAKDGKHEIPGTSTKEMAAAWNSGFGTSVDVDFRTHVAGKILVPDGAYVPVPGAVLLGFLGLGYAGMRLRKMV